MTTPSPRIILVKLKIEVTKDTIHHVGKNGEHFYGENFIYEYPSKRHIKSNQHMGILHAFSNCVRATFNHGPFHQKLTGVIKKDYLQNMDPASWKLTGEANSSSTTPHVDACSWKLTQEATSTSTTPHGGACSWKLTGEANS